MTNSLLAPALPFADPRSDKARAFRTAARHSAHVRAMRKVIVASAVALVAGIGLYVAFDPFRAVPRGVSVEGIGIEGTKVTMSHPRLAGFHTDGRPYEILASAAVQDVKVPTRFELHDMDAHLTMADKTVTHVTAALGVYDSQHDLMDLTSAVHITSDAGLDVRTRDAHVEFKSGSVVTRNPVTVAMHGSSITADGMTMVNGGQQVTFQGHVHTFLLPDRDKAGTQVPQAAAP